MRTLLWVVLAAAALWGGYWFAGSTALERAVRQGLADQGAVAAATDVAVRGFPNRFDLTLTDPRFGDAARGDAVWQAPFLQTFALSYKPWHLIAAFPPRQTVTLPDGPALVVDADKLQASLILTPDTTLALDRFTVEGAALTLSVADRPAGVLDALLLATRADPSRKGSHDIWLDLTGLAPAQGVLSAAPGQTLPQGSASLHIEASVGFSAPLDRNAGATRPYPERIDVGSARLEWDAIRFDATGSLTPDANGFAEGRIELRLSGWEQALAVAVAAGALRADLAPTWSNMVRGMADSDGTPGTVVLPLTFADGQIRVGPFPLGPAPLMRP